MHALDAIPGDAFLVATLDVDGLRRSPLGAPLFGGVASKLAGEKALTDLCGFDPLGRISEIAIAVPEEGGRGDFGIAIRADVGDAELLACAQKVIASKHADVATPTIREQGSYTLIEPDSADADPEHRFPTLAYRSGGPYLIARGPWLSAMVDAVEGRLPSVAASEGHAAIRRELSRGPVSPSAIVTAVLPKGFRQRLKEELQDELGIDDGNAPSPGARSAIVNGVLGVGSAGIGVVAGASGSDAQVDAVFRCEGPEPCAEVKRLVLARRLDWSQQISLRLLGLGPLLDSMKVEDDGTLVRVTARAPAEDAAAWLDRVLTLRGVHHPTAGPLEKSAPGRPPPRGLPSADEVLRPQIDAGRLDPHPNPP